MPLCAYGAICVLVPALWSLVLSRAIASRERKRRAASAAAPPVDYSI
ncbi:MAG: hypothetical protein IT370_36050 [Deltaproteobacteria bacterium]|nr:hypothetical protein [Deltaproteobacteria bacterium]